MWWDDFETPEDFAHVSQLPLGRMLRRVAPLFRPHLRLLGIGLLLMLVSVAAELAGPVLLMRIIDVYVPAGSRAGVVTSALLYGGLFLLGTTAGYFQVVVLSRMGLAVVTALKRNLFAHVLDLSLGYFDRNPPGRLLARVESDSERLLALFSEVGIAVFRTVLLTLGTLTVMVLTSWQVTLALVALAAPVVGITVLFFGWMRGLFQRVRVLYARISTFVTEYVQGVPILQAFGYERRAAARLAALNDDKLVADRNVSLLEYGFWGLLTAVEVVAVMLILYFGSGHVLGITVTVGTLVLFVEYTRRIFWPLAMFAEQVSFMQRAFASTDRVFGVLDTPTRTPDRPGALERVPDDWRELAFDGITFAYDGGARALDGVSFRVRRGEKVALVGLSGGGKTTITSLLLRYYESAEGAIRLDGRDIRDFTKRAWRERIGLVLQDIHLFPGSVDENLRALSDDIPRASLERAVAIVGADEVVARLPGGYDGELAEGGANLSMGERQLLSFARAVVRDPDILVLDEATSSVDPATERRLQRSVDRLLEGRTSLVIAHRLSTVITADRILVVHRGRLAEEGTHAALYAQGGIYRDLFDLQFRSDGAPHGDHAASGDGRLEGDGIGAGGVSLAGDETDGDTP